MMGSSIMYGRNFTLSAGGGLSMGSLLGISATGLLGNIQVSGTRSYSTGADYVYSGGLHRIQVEESLQRLEI